MGTRADCIARSAELNVNTHPNEAGLVEAVTCDLYDFGRRRHHECVCYPVYSKEEAHEWLAPETTHNPQRAASTFYPPPMIVQRALLAAASGGPPASCTKGCPETAKLIQHQDRPLKDFPYCATPGQLVEAQVVPRTLVETRSKAKHGKLKTYTTTYPDVPSTTPDCDDEKYLARSSSACAVDKCMWSFVQNYTLTTSHWITYTDASGNKLWMDWSTEDVTVTTRHWGVLPPWTNPKSMSQNRQTDPWKAAMATSYSNYRTSIGLPAPPRNEQDMKKQRKLAEEQKPVCKDEGDCWRWCEEGQKKKRKEEFVLLGLAAIITALGLLGVILKKCWDARKRFEAEKEGTELGMVDIDTQPGSTAGGTNVPQPGVEATTGDSLQREAEEGRGRGRVRFSPEGGATAATPVDEAVPEGARKVSGRQAQFEMSERGSIRNRLPSYR